MSVIGLSHPETPGRTKRICLFFTQSAISEDSAEAMQRRLLSMGITEDDYTGKLMQTPGFKEWAQWVAGGWVKVHDVFFIIDTDLNILQLGE